MPARLPLRQLFALLCLLPLAAVAHERPLTYDRVSLSEEAGQEVENDLLVAVLYVQREGSRAQVLADEVNQVIDTAVTQVKGIPGIKVQTQSYRTSAVYKNNSIAGWRVNQSIRLESRDSKLLGDTIGKLQGSLNVQSISYRISDEQRRRHMDELVETALQRFQQRAGNIARTLGRSRFRIVSLNIHDGHGARPVRAELMMDAAPMARMASAPARIEAGTQRLTVTVNGEIELSLD